MNNADKPCKNMKQCGSTNQSSVLRGSTNQSSVVRVYTGPWANRLYKKKPFVSNIASGIVIQLLEDTH